MKLKKKNHINSEPNLFLSETLIMIYVYCTTFFYPECLFKRMGKKLLKCIPTHIY